MNLNKYFIYTFIISQFLIAENNKDIIVLSIKVGSSIDAAENSLIGLFPDINNFESAQFYKLSENRYMAKIIYSENNRRKIKKRRYSWLQLQRLKYKAGSHPYISNENRQKQLDLLSFLQDYNVMDDIPLGAYCLIKHKNGKLFTGTFLNYTKNTIDFQSPIKKMQFSLEDLESISYKPLLDDGLLWKKMLAFGIGASLGLTFAEIWNIQKRPRIDMIWYNRFFGLGVGLFTGREIFEAVSVLASPKKVISLIP
ncbi:MAG: hypothetical protein CMG75_01805 [Candidatus Marinimicrobia bacterium]|mgnify:CR=1 FL=1|nr:hypothetical protein [Candidatus Neomarinimicrobiota bacterium]